MYQKNPCVGSMKISLFNAPFYLDWCVLYSDKLCKANNVDQINKINAKKSMSMRISPSKKVGCGSSLVV